ncbi:hypothetical protein [Comamonas resistens]|uniref:hypothetical protein n=1 Tax=Comamonas resistens TaxID=3046670 RepID=UPI0039BCC432
MTRPEELQKSAALLVIPVLLTMWFVSDGGLRNGLNRLVFELIVGAFFASYGLLWGGSSCSTTGAISAIRSICA